MLFKGSTGRGGENPLFLHRTACGCRSGRQQDRHDATDKEWLALFTADRRLTKSGIQQVQRRDIWFGVRARLLLAVVALKLSSPVTVRKYGKYGELTVVWWTCNGSDRGVWEASGAP